MSKKIVFQLMACMVVCLSVCFSSCSKDDDEDELEQTTNVSSQDPEGTIVLNMSSGASGNYYQIGNLCEIHIDEANNFKGERSSGAKFVSVGLVSGLGKITQIPTSGWAQSAAVVPGTGYVMRYGDQYARIYVVEYLGMTYTDEQGNTYGQTTGATIKYQAPFQLPIKIANTTLTFTSDAGSQTLQFENPTSATVEGKPEWCEVTRNETGITVTVSENLTATQRTGEIVLKNTANSVTINVTQKGASSPKFQAGSGTEQEPYQITNAQQLKYITKALNAHFVLTADISLNEETAGSGWDPIGKQEAPFTGTLDGQGHAIKNMWMKRPSTNGVGLFGYINNASISNLRLEISSNGINGGENVGGICGSANNQCLIQKCSVSGELTGSSTIGGICGYAYNTTFEQCYSEGSISTNTITWRQERCAGIVGRGGKVTNCYSTVSLAGHSCYGISEGSVSKCYFAGKVSSYSCYFSCPGSYTYYESSSITASNYIYNQENARTTAQMKTQSNYEGWDFTTIWQITEGKTYPILRCFDRDQQEKSQEEASQQTVGNLNGNGTLDAPFNVAAVIEYCQQIGDKESDKEVYIKGKVSSVKEQFGTQYGNATFNISEDSQAKDEFTVYRALYLGNKKYTSGALLQKGDEVIVCGKVTCFKGNTPETVQNKAYLYSLNGRTTAE